MEDKNTFVEKNKKMELKSRVTRIQRKFQKNKNVRFFGSSIRNV